MAKIKCLECNEILESNSRHDFKRCGCPNSAFIDGGSDYMRLGGKDLMMVEYWNEKENKFMKLKLATNEEDEQLEFIF